jgi:hypothetical protein
VSKSTCVWAADSEEGRGEAMEVLQSRAEEGRVKCRWTSSPLRRARRRGTSRAWPTGMRPATAEHAAGHCSRILLRLGRAGVNTPVGQTVVVVGGGGTLDPATSDEALWSGPDASDAIEEWQVMQYQ